MPLSPLPQELGPAFSTATGRKYGLSKKRLRASDLYRPFRGARLLRVAEDPSLSVYELQRSRELNLIHALAARLADGQFFCRRSAALLWGAPVPYRGEPPLDLGVILPQRAPRVRTVTGHSFNKNRVVLTQVNGLPLTSPASTFASLGDLSLIEIVALGDFFLRKYRQGVGRKHVGKPPLATLEELAQAVGLGRWRGASKLRSALELVREDSWSPRESWARVTLVSAGLPEPELNVDVFDDRGRFLGCGDLVYRKYRTVVEYQGEHHALQFDEDTERAEVFKSAHWEMLFVTKTLARRPDELVRRVGNKLRERGWKG